MVLDASGNMLTELEESTFRHGSSMERLLLQNNWITTIHPRALAPLKSLQHLDLTNNYIEELNTVALKPVEKSLVTLKLGGNPWNCGCEVSELWSWLQDHLSYIPEPEVVKCELPKALQGHSFLLLSSSAFCPQPLILRLAIQDIQSQSLLVSWQAANSTSIYGFKVSFQITAGDGRVLGSLKSRSLPSSPRTFQLEGLRPDTSYLICVQGLTTALRPVSRARPHTQEDASTPDHPPVSRFPGAARALLRCARHCDVRACTERTSGQ
ncbi:Toll-like receptor 3 [Penaeus vannamei]|uniref:Toll-like receptor 3 n=1 Tax=Penaeus vannamei TaxID=6689 RepID=A0A3R7NNM8_PENVA|nr:Toll-like receptor 3 [Penaeus vannamei]